MTSNVGDDKTNKCAIQGKEKLGRPTGTVRVQAVAEFTQTLFKI